MWSLVVAAALAGDEGPRADTPEALLASFYAGIDAMSLTVPVEASAFDAFIMDDAGKPARLSGPDGLARFEGMLASWKQQGYGAVTQIEDVRCDADKRVAWCGAALSQELLMQGAFVDRLALRVTMVMVRSRGGWRLAQVHESANG